MWTYEHSIETAASATAIFRLYSDVSTWPEWDEGLTGVTLDGPFTTGSKGTITPQGQDALPFRLTLVAPDQGFTDETDLPGAGVTLRFVHILTPIENGQTRITHRVEIVGPAAEEVGPTLGPQVTADTPAAMAALVLHALQA
jgi:hypothetical protein